MSVNSETNEENNEPIAPKTSRALMLVTSLLVYVDENERNSDF